MKTTTLFLIIIAIAGCSFGQIEKPTQFIFKSFSRGFSESIIIREDSTFISERHSSNKPNKDIKTTTTKTEWQQILKSIQPYRFQELVLLPSPTNRRQVDAAPFSRINIVTPSQEYNGGEFDGYNPNQKLKALMQAILDIKKNKG